MAGRSIFRRPMRPLTAARPRLTAAVTLVTLLVPAAPALATLARLEPGDAPVPARWPDQGATSTAGFAKRLEHDLLPLVAAPAHWQRHDWTHFAAGLALVGTARVFDGRVRESVRMDPGETQPGWYPALRSFGQAGGLALLGAGWIAGHFSHRPEVVATAQDGLEAVILAAGVITPALKLAAGRARPNQGEGPASFQPFGGDLSFPSGEVTEAFAIASVIAAHTEHLWLQGTVWTLAGAVGWERLRLDAHWSSDVVAGALIGGAVGNWVVHRHAPAGASEARFDLLPLVSRQGRGVALHVAL